MVRKSGIPISQALQSAQDTFDAARIAEEGASTTLKLFGVEPNLNGAGKVLIPIVSPIDGIVAARTMVVGQNVDPSATLARIINLDKIFIDAQIYEKDIEGALAGDLVSIHVPAFPERTFNGKVQYVAKEVNSDTRTVLVRTVLNNPGWVLRPGMFASVLIGSAKATRSLSVPSVAVMQEAEKQIVYVRVAPGKFVRRVITVGAPIGNKTPIKSGLTSGDEVVVSGNVLIQKAQQQLESGKSGS
jgi:hypothetical protein